jgi:hypothetical protein
MNDTGAVWRREQPCASATFCSPRAAASGHNTVCILLVLAGRAKAQMDESIAAAIDKKELPAMDSGAMCYMMSKQGYAGDSTPHWPPHLMFFYSETDPAIWGANLPGSPVFAVAAPPEQLTSFVITAQHWSDGTEFLQAPPHVHP